MDLLFIMNVNRFPEIICIISIIMLLIYKKRENKKLKRILVVGFLFGFIVPLIPHQVFGNWNAIKKFEDKGVSKIELRPSTPGWEVNLTDSAFIIHDKNQINTICNFLHNCDLYFAQHSNRVWEANMILIGNDGDTLLVEINKLENNCMVINVPRAELRNDDLDNYLETVTNYNKPQIGDK